MRVAPSLLLVLGTTTALALAGEEQAKEAETRLLEGDNGIAAKYPGDAGIERDPAVVFVEGFEEAGLDGVKRRWTQAKDGGALELAGDVPEGSSGRKSLRVTATRGKNDGGHLFKNFEGIDTAHLRYYAKFAEDCGLVHHFVRFRGMIDPVPYPMGQASKGPNRRWCGADVEPWPADGLAPPGRWGLAAYWIGMRSWQGPGGRSFYPNEFTRKDLLPVERGKWSCVELMVRLNSAAEKHDGALAYWIDGKLAAHFAPGTVKGTWLKDKFHISGRFNRDPGPFEGFRWRSDMRLKMNRLWLLLFVSDRVFGRTDAYTRANPGAKVNAKSASVLFDHVVIAKKYVGPIFTKKDGPEPSKVSRAPAASPREAKRGADEKEAGRLFQMARQAERMGQRGVAKRLYAQIVEKYPDTEIAGKAKAKLE